MTDVELDRSLLAELVEMDPVEGLELVRDLVAIFFREAPARLDLMRCGVSLGDRDRVVRGAHAMKGAASGLGAIGMAEACGRIECRARSGSLTGLSAEVDQVEAELPGLAWQLDGYLNQLARQPLAD